MKNLINKLKNKFYAFYIAFLTRISPYTATKILYKNRTGKKLDLNSPRHFNEKIQWLKLYWQHPLVAKCGDKYEVREYAIKKGCSDALIQTYGIYEQASEINWSSLPNKFVIKITNGSGYNIICKDKNKLDKEKVITQLNNWLKKDFSLIGAEIHYAKMKSRILCEKFIETEDGKLPIDYKIYCFNGEPKYILVTPDREVGFKRYFYDLEWNILNFEEGIVIDESDIMRKPESLQEMLYYSKKLSSPFPFVRVDFYDYNGKAILGEMTFTPAAGLATYYREEVSLKLGGMIQLPEKMISS